MFKLNMTAIRKSANSMRLLANPDNVTNRLIKPEVLHKKSTDEAQAVSQIGCISHISPLATVESEIFSECKNDELPTTSDSPLGMCRPSDLPPKLLAASKALDMQIVVSGLSLTPPEQPKPKLASVNKQGIWKVDTPTPKPSKVKHVDREWKPLATAYLQHHGHCAACIAAGVNPRYQRCGTGAILWSLYQSAIQ